MIAKVRGGYATKHCHSKERGKVISRFGTKGEAQAQHRAIMAGKHRHKRGNPSAVAVGF